MTKLPFRNESFIVGDLVIPSDYYNDINNNIGIVIATNQINGSVTVHWQKPVNEGFSDSKTFEETLPEYIYKRVA